MLVRVLVAADPASERRRLLRMLRGPGVEPVATGRNHSLLEVLSREDIDIVLLSRESLEEPARERVSLIRSMPENPEVVVLCEVEDARDRVELLASGCLAVLNRNLPDESLRDCLRSLLRRRREESIRRLQAERPEERYSLADFFSESPLMRRFLELARKVAASDTSLLVLGETGVGKERLARGIHGESRRAQGPFMAVNCGALPESLLESELFGHEEGAFTGATRARRGYFELAHRGTLFLDEIGEMPVHLQVKILRAVQDRTIQRVGGEKQVKVDVRIMAASNRDLETDMKNGRFRADLYFRLAVVSLKLPALRERREDIPHLAQSYLDTFRLSLGRNLTGIEDDAMEALVAYGWPGNVRELINVMEQACLLSPGPMIGLGDLPHRIASDRETTPDIDSRLDIHGYLDGAFSVERRRLLAAFEKEFLNHILDRSRGKVGVAANLAGLNQRSLYGLMKRYGLRKEDFRN